MQEFAVLTNRKRAIIALIHSVFFLLLAILQLRSERIPAIWYRIHGHFGSAVALFMIYLIVTSILFWLTGISRSSIERFYFGFCSVSAGTGLLRAIFGDISMHAAPFVRVLMLGCAVVTGFLILKLHSEPELAE